MIEENEKEFKVGQVLYIVTNTCSVVCGVLMMIADQYAGAGQTQRVYRIRITDNVSIDLPESFIQEMRIITNENIEFLKAFEEKYGIRCFDVDDNMMDTQTVVNAVLEKGVWDKLNEVEKEKLIDSLQIDHKYTVDLINALTASHKYNDALHNKVMGLIDQRGEALHAVIEFQKNYDKICKAFPDCKWAYEFVFKYFGMDKLLKTI